jgi:hypothetical protein
MGGEKLPRGYWITGGSTSIAYVTEFRQPWTDLSTGQDYLVFGDASCTVLPLNEAPSHIEDIWSTARLGQRSQKCGAAQTSSAKSAIHSKALFAVEKIGENEILNTGFAAARRSQCLTFLGGFSVTHNNGSSS